jgi:hypothetical protein
MIRYVNSEKLTTRLGVDREILRRDIERRDVKALLMERINAADPGPIHANVGNKIAPFIDHRDVHGLFYFNRLFSAAAIILRASSSVIKILSREHACKRWPTIIRIPKCIRDRQLVFRLAVRKTAFRHPSPYFAVSAVPRDLSTSLRIVAPQDRPLKHGDLASGSDLDHPLLIVYAKPIMAKVISITTRSRNSSISAELTA